MTTADQTRTMRDFTKSAFSFSWAISLLSINRASDMLSGTQYRDMLAPMTQIATDQLDQFLREIYRSGDDLQARVVDLAFSWVDPAAWLKPEKWQSLLPGVVSKQQDSLERDPAESMSEPEPRQRR